MSIGDKFKCEQCGNTFISNWKESEKLEEKARLFPEYSMEECCLVCTDCFNYLNDLNNITDEGKNEK